jgi:hypothetical protein
LRLTREGQQVQPACFRSRQGADADNAFEVCLVDRPVRRDTLASNTFIQDENRDQNKSILKIRKSSQLDNFSEQ